MMALHHVGITVRDLRASIEFYCEFVGCKLRRETRGRERSQNAHGLTRSRCCHCRH